MSCTPITAEDFEEIKKLSAEFSKTLRKVPRKQEQLIRLPRGGIIIQTSLGNVQFGMPPETVKDSMMLGIDVPEIYVIPTKRFDFKSCLNVAEFEFPAYFNFFIRRKQVTLVCSEEAKDSIMTIFNETLLGPTVFEDIEEEFDSNTEKEAIPNFPNEMKYFAKNPFTGERLTIDAILQFVLFDKENVAHINEDVQIQKRDGIFQVVEKGKTVAIIPDDVEIEEFEPHQTNPEEAKEEIQQAKKSHQEIPSLEEIQDLQGGLSSLDNINPTNFVPPSFGVTVLGHSHGFDPKGCTSGYIIWVNGRGVMVDPPPFATQQLKRMGIPSRLIDSVIISHCHGDHDAAVFQKILDTHKVEIITTKTILRSFVKKYSAILNMPPGHLSSLFKFKPVILNAPLYINGAEFKFFYSLHSIPAIGFSASYNKKSLYFSADTFYDPQRLSELVKEGVITQKRCDSLCKNIWDHDLILHEAGVPPIHTPMKVLSNLPNEVKDKTLLVHVAAKDIPQDSGLKVAPCGLNNTIVIDSTPVDHFNILNMLDVVCSIDIFRNVSLRTMKDVILAGDKEFFKAGQTIIDEGEAANKFYIIITGIVRVFSNGGPDGGFDRYYQIGDFFGEGIVSKGSKRVATAVATTEVKVLTISKSNFIFFFGENIEVMTKMENFIQIRKHAALRVIRKNSVFGSLTSSQKLELESILYHRNVSEDEIIWKKGDTPEFALLIFSGNIEVTYDNAEFSDDEDNTDEFSHGIFISETKTMLEGGKCKLTLKALNDCSLFIVKKSDYLRFLSNNPKLKINLSLNNIVE